MTGASRRGPAAVPRGGGRAGLRARPVEEGHDGGGSRDPPGRPRHVPPPVVACAARLGPPSAVWTPGGGRAAIPNESTAEVLASRIWVGESGRTSGAVAVAGRGGRPRWCRRSARRGTGPGRPPGGLRGEAGYRRHAQRTRAACAQRAVRRVPCARAGGAPAHRPGRPVPGDGQGDEPGRRAGRRTGAGGGRGPGAPVAQRRRAPGRAPRPLPGRAGRRRRHPGGVHAGRARRDRARQPVLLDRGGQRHRAPRTRRGAGRGAGPGRPRGDGPRRRGRAAVGQAGPAGTAGVAHHARRCSGGGGARDAAGRPGGDRRRGGRGRRCRRRARRPRHRTGHVRCGAARPEVLDAARRRGAPADRAGRHRGCGPAGRPPVRHRRARHHPAGGRPADPHDRLSAAPPVLADAGKIDSCRRPRGRAYPAPVPPPQEATMPAWPATIRSRTVRRVAVAGGLALSVLALATPARAATIWSVRTTPNRGGLTNSLYAVTAGSASSLWAVGSWYDVSLAAGRTLALHGDGTGWSTVSTPNATTGYNELVAVDASSSTNAWAVGYSAPAGGGSRRAISMRWNGTAWSEVATPPVGGVGGNNLFYSVTALSGNQVWAAGYTSTANGPQPLVERWNGTAWSVESTPVLPLGGTAGGVSAVAGSPTVWVAGTRTDSVNGSLTDRTLILRGTGT